MSPPPFAAAGGLTQAYWFGPTHRPLMGWMSYVPGAATRSGVVMLPAVGYEWWSSHRTVRTVAEGLAVAGHLVLRIDYDGTGDSAGRDRDPDRVEAWRESARSAADAVRAIGCRRVSLVGVQLGGLIALTDASALGADAVVAWAPPPSGRRFARELRMRSEPLPGDDDSVAVAGTRFDASLLEELRVLDPGGLESPLAEGIALVGDGVEPLRDRLRAHGASVEHSDLPGSADALAVPTEDAVVPEEVVAAIVASVGPADPQPLAPPAENAEAELDWDGGRVVERVARISDRGLVGVLTAPVDGRADTVVIWLNSGSEPHVGSGRAWVEYSRALALRGHASLRLDFSGWGESPDLEHAPGRPYDAHGIAETAGAIRAVRELGYEHVVVAGLCAGAWIALRTMLEEPVAGVIAFNPQLYWRPGDPVEALMRDTHERRTVEREREARGDRLGLWTLLDRLGHRPWAARWLDAIAASETPVCLCFAEGDDGLEYLNRRLSRRLRSVTAAGRITVLEVPDIDHSMHRFWLRDRIISVVGDFLDGLS